MSTVPARDRDAVLFVRVETALIERLDRLTTEERKKRQGMGASRSDVVRSILWEAIHERERARRERREQGEP